MPISSDIYSAIQAPAQFNPLAEMAQFEHLRGMQQQNQLGQLAFGDKQRALADQERMRGIYGQGLQGPELENALLRGGFQAPALALQKGRIDANESTAKIGEQRAKAQGATFDNFKAALGTVQDPSQARQLITAAYHDPDMGPLLQRFGSLEDGLARIPMDPQGFSQWRATAAIGVQKLAEMAKVQNVNLGGTMQTQTVQPATGQVTVNASAPITVDANTVANNATSRANNAATVGEMARGHTLADARARETIGAAVTKPFEVTGPDGNPVLVQQDKQGNITPVAGYSPKGGTSKPLPGGVVKQLTEARDNSATIDRLASSFKPDFANKGILGFGADASLITKGTMGFDGDAVEWWKNYRKQAELVERHALFGAALTPGEQSSWRSADIGPGMDDKVIQRNLATRSALAKKVFENTTQDLIDAGHSEKRIGAIAGRSTAIAPAAQRAPAVGAIQGGYRFKGGNPADQSSWERQ
jgi:hypothetical protein